MRHLRCQLKTCIIRITNPPNQTSFATFSPTPCSGSPSPKLRFALLRKPLAPPPPTPPNTHFVRQADLQPNRAFRSTQPQDTKYQPKTFWNKFSSTSTHLLDDIRNSFSPKTCASPALPAKNLHHSHHQPSKSDKFRNIFAHPLFRLSLT